ncbi:hypothetical protein LJC59_02045 [Desulfovibrio sp. OttesenSCG-928-A18]|nr:hypothetical protein [Desulfovibrio sp. OttesenSCG-928-A18]
MKQTQGPRADMLLARPGQAAIAGIEKILEILATVFAIPASHRRALPLAVRELSRMLTEERSGLACSYWSAPRFLAAYLYYFLPWNLYRLAWLLPGLDLPLRENSRILDLGSGPLTMPLALWCARPDLRTLPLEFTCSDVAPRPMELGRNILNRLNGGRWRVHLLRAPLQQALRLGRDKGFDCITAANVLNEPSFLRQTGQEEPLARRLDALCAQAGAALRPGASFLLVEPGTRLGGKLLALCREGALRQGLRVLAPCTHCGPCPMSGRGAMGFGDEAAYSLREGGGVAAALLSYA